MSGCLRKQVVYFNSFYGLRLVDFDPFWSLLPIHKVEVPLLLLYIKTNCLRRKLKGSKQLFKGCEKALAASEFKTDCCTLISFNYYFLAQRFLTILGGLKPPCDSPCYGTLSSKNFSSVILLLKSISDFF